MPWLLARMARLACGGTNLIHLWDHLDCDEAPTVCLWDMAQGTRHAVLHGHQEGVTSVVFSVDGASILSGSADGTIKIWIARPAIVSRHYS